MASSIVSCPGCQKRLKLGTDQPGGKLRCPACNTPFVLGSRTNPGATGMAELLAFELFEDDVATDNFEIAEDKPSQPKIAARPTPSPPKPEPKPTSKPTSKSTPKPAVAASKPAPKKESNLLPDDLDLLGDGPSKPAVRPAPPPPAPKPQPPKAAEPASASTPVDPPSDEEESQSGILPDDFAGLDEKWMKLSADKKTSAASSSKSKAESRNQPQPNVESRTEPRPSVKPAPKKDDEFFLPANFDLGAFAAPGPKADPIPNLTLDDDRSASAPIYEDFEVIEPAPRVASDGVPLIEGVSDEEVAEIEQSEREFAQKQEEREFRARNREERRQKRAVRRTAAQAINAQVRGRWLTVFWGITLQLAGTVAFGIGWGLLALAFLAGLLSAGIGSPELAVIPVILLIISSVVQAPGTCLKLTGICLCIACPAKNNARIWAIVGIFLGPVGHLMFLKYAAESLKEYSLADECLKAARLYIATGIALLMVFLMFAVVWAIGIASAGALVRSVEDAKALGWILATVFLVFLVATYILVGTASYKYFLCLSEFRAELRWRLES